MYEMSKFKEDKIVLTKEGNKYVVYFNGRVNYKEYLNTNLVIPLDEVKKEDDNKQYYKYKLMQEFTHKRNGKKIYIMVWAIVDKWFVDNDKYLEEAIFNILVNKIKVLELLY